MSHLVHMAPRATRLRTGRAFLALLPILGACEAERSTAPSSPSAIENASDEPEVSPTTATASATASCSAPSWARVVAVNSATALKSALSSARAGDFIVLADGKYTGRFEAAKVGTAERPITLCGSKAAELNGGSLSGGYGLYLNRARYWVFRGFRVTNAMKGIMLDGAYDNVLDGLTVHDIRDEVIHLRRHSSDNVLQNNHLYRGGRGSHNGEGIYLGSAQSNWGSYTGGKPDRVSNNKILDNLIEDMTAEGIELKEGTRSNLIEGNTIRRAGRQVSSSGGVGSGASIATRGGSSTFSNNAISGCSGSCPDNGIQVYSGGQSGDGDNNTFRDNIVDVNSKGYGFHMHSSQSGNVLSCSNKVTDAARGMSNTKCR